MNKKNPEVSQVHTTCRNCVFATFDKTGGHQDGCSLNKLDDYRNAGVEVMDVYDDQGTEFCLINGRFCMFYRTKDLMERYPHDSWKDIVRLQTKVPYHAIIFVEKETTFSELKRTINDFRDQEIKPNLLTVINKQYAAYSEEPDKHIKPSLMLELLSNCKFHQYSVKNVYDDSLNDRDLVDLAFDSTKDKPYPFYTTFRAGFRIPPLFSKELNDAILIKMLQLGYADPIDDLNGMIVNRVAHKKHGGNAFGIHIEEKILEFEDNAEKFIFKAEEICPSLKQ